MHIGICTTNVPEVARSLCIGPASSKTETLESFHSAFQRGFKTDLNMHILKSCG